MNFAVTLRASVISTRHSDILWSQSPSHPSKTCPSSAVAVSRTVVSSSYICVQVESAPQLMPVPATLPLPTTFTVSVHRGLNFAVTLRASVISNGPHVLSIPVQAPSHLSKA